MGQRAVQPEANVFGLGVRRMRVRRGCIHVDEHIVAGPAQIRHRHVPAQHRQRFAGPGALGAVGATGMTRTRAARQTGQDDGPAGGPGNENAHSDAADA